MYIGSFFSTHDGYCDTRNMWSDFAVNKYLHTVASGWIFINNVHRSSCKIAFNLVRFNQSWIFSRQTFEKNHKISWKSVQWQPRCCMRTADERADMTKANSRFSQICRGKKGGGLLFTECVQHSHQHQSIHKCNGVSRQQSHRVWCRKWHRYKYPNMRSLKCAALLTFSAYNSAIHVTPDGQRTYYVILGRVRVTTVEI